MQENFLHFLWQHQYFDKSHLHSDAGETIEVLSAGFYNTDSGPDFQSARILIDQIEWVGSIEIHLRASDWKVHKHERNPLYNNVVLHVVWKNDHAVARQDGSTIPTLELEKRVNSVLFEKYARLVSPAGEQIACSGHLPFVPGILKISMLEKAMVQRLEEKGREVLEIYHRTGKDWEETAYRLLAKNFGFKLNADPFQMLAQRLPLKVLQKHKDQLLQVEALLYGQAGFLNRKFKTVYPLQLQKEYAFLAHKYDLQKTRMDGVEWKFMRLRPSNFPTVRIAQFAAIIARSPDIFSLFTTSSSPEEIVKRLIGRVSGYWQQHYQFEKENKQSTNQVGTESLENLIINTSAPLLAALSIYRKDASYLEKAMRFLEQLPAENNRIVRQWKGVGFTIKSAAESQGGIALYNYFCKNKLCLDCSIGLKLIQSD